MEKIEQENQSLLSVGLFWLAANVSYMFTWFQTNIDFILKLLSFILFIVGIINGFKLMFKREKKEVKDK